MLQVIWRLLAVRQRVYRLRISGELTPGSFSQVASALSRRRWTSPVALALVINAEGGSFVQANLVRSMVETYAKQREIPVFSFVEDCALGPGYVVACAAHKIYVRECSVLGGVGTEYVHWNFRKTANSVKIKRHLWVFPQKTSFSDRLSPSKQLSKESTNWLKKLLMLAQSNLLAQISGIRGERVRDWHKLENADWLRGPAALEAGLADAVKGENEALLQELGDVRVLDISQWWSLRNWLPR